MDLHPESIFKDMKIISHFKEVLYKEGPTGHYNGHTVAMTGNYTETGLNLNINPEFPTIFEYYRKFQW